MFIQLKKKLITQRINYHQSLNKCYISLVGNWLYLLCKYERYMEIQDKLKNLSGLNINMHT